MELYLAYCNLLLLYISTQNCQYNVIRTNPFQYLTGTLKTFQGEGCDGGVLGLSCPEGTKVRNFLLLPLYTASLKISIVSVIYGRDVDGSLQCFQFVNQTEDKETCSMRSSLTRVMQECHSKKRCSAKISHENLLTEMVDPCPKIR